MIATLDKFLWTIIRKVIALVVTLWLISGFLTDLVGYALLPEDTKQAFGKMRGFFDFLSSVPSWVYVSLLILLFIYIIADLLRVFRRTKDQDSLGKAVAAIDQMRADLGQTKADISADLAQTKADVVAEVNKAVTSENKKANDRYEKLNRMNESWLGQFESLEQRYAKDLKNKDDQLLIATQKFRTEVDGLKDEVNVMRARINGT